MRVTAFCLVLAPAIARAAPAYQVTRIPTPADEESLALGINDAGDVVGYRTEGEDDHAFLYSYATGALSELGSLGGKRTVARAVNAARQITGFASDASNAVKAFLLSPDQPMAALPDGSGGANSQGFAIDPAGQVAGVVENTSGQMPVMFVDGKLKSLAEPAANEEPPLCTAYGLNAAGDVVGVAKPFGGPARAFFYSATQNRFSDLGTLGGKFSQAFAVNQGGDVVGAAETSEGKVHAFRYSGSQMHDLGTLTGFEAASWARAINDQGLIAGFSEAADASRHAFITEGSQLVDLNTLAGNLAEAGFASLDDAFGVNARGWVVGSGTTLNGKAAAFIAVPNPSELPTAGPAAEPKPKSLDAFYTRLSSKDGEWLGAGSYGYVFRPKVATHSEDWRPYRDGHWVNTDEGWYWDSDESFGWATYHYGGWINIEGVGWCWVPGRHWAPSWVSWRRGDDCVGWAPLPPEAVCVEGNRFEVTPSCDASFGIGPGAYTFIGYDRWSSPRYAEVCYSRAQIYDAILQTTNVTNVVAGPGGVHTQGVDPAFVAARAGTPLFRVGVSVAAAAGSAVAYHAVMAGDTLRVSAPGLHLEPTATVRPAVTAHFSDPRPERGWAGVPPGRLGPLSAALGQARFYRPSAIPGGSEPSPGELLRPSKPFAVPQPINNPPPAGVGGGPRRSVRLLGDQSFSAHVAEAAHLSPTRTMAPFKSPDHLLNVHTAVSSTEMPVNTARGAVSRAEPTSSAAGAPPKVSSNATKEPAEKSTSSHRGDAGAAGPRKEPVPEHSRGVETHRSERHNATVVNPGKSPPAHAHPAGANMPQPRPNSPPAVHSAPPRPAPPPKPKPTPRPH